MLDTDNDIEAAVLYVTEAQDQMGEEIEMQRHADELSGRR